MKYNKYDYLIIFIIASISFGFTFQLIKYIGLISLPVLFFYLLKREMVKIVIFYLLIIHCFTNIVISYYSSLCIKETFVLLSLISIFYLLILLSNKANNPKESIITGWILLVTLTIPFAIYEFVTDFHLSTSVYESESYIGGAKNGIQKTFSAVTFGNYNRYVTLLCIALPFILSYNLYDKNKYKILILIIYLIVSIIILLNSSRGGVIANILTSLVFIYFTTLKTKKKLNKIIIIATYILTSLFIFNIFSEQFIYRIKEKEALFYDDSRNNLISICFNYMLDHPFFGIGIGNLSEYLSKYSDITIPHNLFIEFLVIFGFILFLPICIWITHLFIKGCKISDIRYKFIFIVSIVTLPVVSTINSNYVLNPYIWVYFSTLYIIKKQK